MRRISSGLFVLALFACLGASPTAAQKVIVGEHVREDVSTPHPYPRGDGKAPELVWTDTLHFPGATYIAPHFARFQLAPGDYLVIRSPDGLQHWTYSGLGKADLGLSDEGFFAVHIKGDTAVMELFAVNPEPGWGYALDLYGRGYSGDELRAFWDAGLGEKMNLAPPPPPEDPESICTTNDVEEAKCYQTSEPAMYDKSRAVVRLLLSGSAHCTGWLLGCDGHVMTNEHCIGSQSQLNNIDFEFMAEGADCGTNCQSALACPGTIEASGGTLVAVDAPLDYSLVFPDTTVGGGTNLPDTYGFMQLRDTGAVVGEQLYLPGHPAGWGKQISFFSSYPLEPNPPHASVISLTEPTCSGGVPEVGYWADTQGGSSGSPVLGYTDNRVIALHHCRGSGFCTSGSSPPDDPNRGVPIPDIITSLGANLPGCAACDPPDPPTGVTATANGDNRIDVTWSAVAGADSYNVYRGFGPCPGSGFALVAEGVVGTSYSDTEVSGGTSYAYHVRAFDAGEGCESLDSTCDDATATGLCTLPPDFTGLDTVTNPQGATCSLDLDWLDAMLHCGSAAVYNVYRDTSPGFEPGPGNLLASCVAASEYTDATVDYGQEYFYVVQAEDDSGNGSGLCAGGNEAPSDVEVAGVATGPETDLFTDDVESGGANWTAIPGPEDPGGTAPWEIVTTDSHSPTHSWFVEEIPSVKDQLLEAVAAVAVPPGAPILEFWHHHDTESTFDGGVLEFSIDGGTTWLDILDGNPDRFLAEGYNSVLSTQFGNPLPGRDAWSGDSGGWILTQVDLADFGGMDLLLRWRFGCDESVTETGWWVDDFRVFFGSECAPGGDEIFSDGFESGDISAWSGSNLP